MPHCRHVTKPAAPCLWPPNCRPPRLPHHSAECHSPRIDRRKAAHPRELPPAFSDYRALTMPPDRQPDSKGVRRPPQRPKERMKLHDDASGPPLLESISGLRGLPNQLESKSPHCLDQGKCERPVRAWKEQLVDAAVAGPVAGGRCAGRDIGHPDIPETLSRQRRRPPGRLGIFPKQSPPILYDPTALVVRPGRLLRV